MKSWKRITLAILVLIGGTTSFGYWSFNQLSQAFDDLSASSVASTYSIYSSLKQGIGLASTTLDVFGEVSTSTSSEQATSTDSTSLDSKLGSMGSEQATSTGLRLASTTPERSRVAATSTLPNLSFTSPQANARLYIGCTYQISWQSSTKINSLETELVDAGTRKPLGPITSGIARENTIEKDLKWKVGSVWPGAYYIKVLKVNGAAADFKSKTFEINKMSENISPSEKETICKGTGGSF